MTNTMQQRNRHTGLRTQFSLVGREIGERRVESASLETQHTTGPVAASVNPDPVADGLGAEAVCLREVVRAAKRLEAAMAAEARFSAEGRPLPSLIAGTRAQAEINHRRAQEVLADIRSRRSEAQVA